MGGRVAVFADNCGGENAGNYKLHAISARMSSVISQAEIINSNKKIQNDGGGGRNTFWNINFNKTMSFYDRTL